MENFLNFGGASGGFGAALSPSVKHSILAAIAAQPELVASEVRVSISAGYVVLEGYVRASHHIDDVLAIVENFASQNAIKNFLFCRPY